MAAAILSYIDHAPTPGVVCTICLEPVAQKAMQISCHKVLDCAECMGYWMESQVVHKKTATCPRCRKVVNSSNLTAPDSSIEWKDVQNMEWEESDVDFDDGDDYGEDYGEENSSFGDEDEVCRSIAFEDLPLMGNSMQKRQPLTARMRPLATRIRPLTIRIRPLEVFQTTLEASALLTKRVLNTRMFQRATPMLVQR
jgi:hypothetical protein